MLSTATFGGGCFWCLERPFTIYGVEYIQVGYMGGQSPNPNYSALCTGKTGHVEVVQIQYDPTKLPYELLLNIFLRCHDPADSGGQFLDRGSQYAPVIFCHTAMQADTANAVMSTVLNRIGQPSWAGDIRQAMPFYPAEPEHQQYYATCPAPYKAYYTGSGRAAFTTDFQRQFLSDDQIRVISGHTEPPFNNAYWDHTESGIYCDCLSHEPLFHSQDKYDSGTGWPSFTASLVPLITESDYSIGYERTALYAPQTRAHLGHVFDDGPNNLPRYCINSGSLVFYAAPQS